MKSGLVPGKSLHDPRENPAGVLLSVIFKGHRGDGDVREGVARLSRLFSGDVRDVSPPQSYCRCARRLRSAYAETFERFPQICMLHQRRVPFLLVS